MKEDVIKLIETYKPMVIAGNNFFYGGDLSVIELYTWENVNKVTFTGRYHNGVVLDMNRACPIGW